jgi:hypothetical protein
MSVSRCQEEVDAAEYHEWQALYCKEPFGDLRDDMRAAKTVQAILAPHVKKQPTLGECMLYPPPKPKAKPEHIMMILRAYTQSQGGRAE